MNALLHAVIGPASGARGGRWHRWGGLQAGGAQIEQRDADEQTFDGNFDRVMDAGDEEARKMIRNEERLFKQTR
jgi:hypothetical protein